MSRPRDTTFHLMNSLKAFFLLPILLLGTSPFSTRAQTETTRVSPPSPLYLNSLKGDVLFSKKISYKTPPLNPNLTEEQKKALKFLSNFPKVTEVRAVQTGDLRRDQQTLSDGTWTEIWRSGSNRFTIYSSSPSYIVVNFVMQDGYQDPPDFPELNWINAESFQGVKIHDGKKCYFYKSSDSLAWVDQSTLCPIGFESASQEISYSYASPDSPLRLPDKFVKKLDEIKKAWSTH